MLEKIKNFFQKLNNSYIIAAICVILICVILLGAIIGLVTRPFSTNTTYISSRIETSGFGPIKIRVTLLDDGRYSKTTHYILAKDVETVFGDYGYAKKHVYVGDESVRCNTIWFDNEYLATMTILDNPFKLEFYGFELVNVGGIVLLVCYCVLFAICAAIATILIIKRKNGGMVFTNKLRLVKRLKEIEEMLGK